MIIIALSLVPTAVLLGICYIIACKVEYKVYHEWRSLSDKLSRDTETDFNSLRRELALW